MNRDGEDRTFAQTIVDTIRESLVILDEDLKVISANRSFYRKFRVSREETEGRLIFDLGNGQWNIPQLRHLLERIIPEQESVEDFEVTHRFESIGKKVIRVNARRMLQNNHPVRLLMALEDISAQYEAQKRLEESEARYRKFTEEANSIVIGLDREGRITFFSSFAEKLFGYHRDEVEGKHIVGMVIPEIDSFGENNRTMIGDLLAKHETFYSNESEGIRKDGSRVWFSWSANVIRDESGEISEILIDGNDITELAKTRREAAENAATLNTLLDSIPEGIIITDARHEIRRVSRNMAQMLGASAEELAGTDEAARMEKIDLHWLDGTPVAPGELPTSKAADTGQTFIQYEMETGLDGTNRVFSVNSAPIRGIRGEVVGAIGAWRDITDSRRAQEALKESEQRFHAAVDNYTSVFVIYDKDRRIQYINKAGLEVSGLTEDQILGHIDEEIIPPEVCCQYVPYLKQAIETGQKQHFEYSYELNGKDYTNIVDYVPLYRDDGKLYQVLGITVDITDRRKTEEALRESETRLTAIMNQLPVGVGVLDRKGNLILANPVLSQFTPENAVPSGDPVLSQNWRVIDEQGKAAPPKIWPSQRAMNGESVVPGVEFLHILDDGKEMWVSVSAGPLRSAKGEIEGAILVGEEITERKKAMNEAQRRRAEVEAILESIPDGFIIYDQNGAILQINQRARDVLGFNDDNSDTSYAERIKHLKITSAYGTLVPVEKMPSYRAFTYRETVRDEILRIFRGDRHYWVSVSASPIVVNDQVVGAFMEFSDITGLHELQEKLTEERNFVNAILQTSGALILVFDLNGRIVQFNKACERSTGFTAEQMIGHTFYDLIPENERKGVEEVTKRLNRGEMMVEHENHWVSRSGEWRYIRWMNSVLLDESGEIAYGVASGIDITDRKRLQEEVDIRAKELNDVNKELESFSYSVSHDLRTPLSVITSFSSILLEDYADKLDEEGKQYLSLMADNVEKMRSLIDDILSLSRVGRYEMSREEIDLSQMVGSYLEELHSADPARKTQFMIQNNVRAVVDPRLLHMALENILRNAWKFTSKKEITRIEFGTLEKNGEMVYFIRDNGAGFDSQYSEKIFEPFRRVHAEKEFTGTGVGLSIVQRVISRHGGRVWAEGEVGKGAVFYFTLRQG